MKKPAKKGAAEKRARKPQATQFAKAVPDAPPGEHEPIDPFFDRSKTGIAYRLRLIRIVLGFDKAKTFAQRAGIHASTYSQYETGTNVPSLDECHKLCDAHKLTLDWIFRGNASTLQRPTEHALEVLHQARTPLPDNIE